MRGLRGRRKVPKVRIIWGEKGIKSVKFLGDLPRDFRGQCTGMLYAFNERRSRLNVDARDLPGLAQDGGRENFEGLPEAEVKAKPKRKKPRPAPEPQVEAEPQEEIAEVTDGR